jgi:hypothetical protein
MLHSEILLCTRYVYPLTGNVQESVVTIVGAIRLAIQDFDQATKKLRSQSQGKPEALGPIKKKYIICRRFNLTGNVRRSLVTEPYGVGGENRMDDGNTLLKI